MEAWRGMKEAGMGDAMLDESPVRGPDCEQCQKALFSLQSVAGGCF